MVLMAASGYQWNWETVFSHDALVVAGEGLKYSFVIALLSLLIGNVLGLVIALLRLSGRKYLSVPAYLYTEFFRNTPPLVQLIWIFYVLPILFGITLPPIWAGVTALSLNAGAFLAEIFRAGLQSIERGQHDACSVLGLSPVQTFRYVTFPQAIRRVLPPAGNVFISLIKDSSLLSVIAVPELTYQAQVFVTATFRPLEIYTILAVMYFLLTYPLSLLTTWLERRFPVT